MGLGFLLYMATAAHAFPWPISAEDWVKHRFVLACNIAGLRAHEPQHLKVGCREANGVLVPAPYAGPDQVFAELTLDDGKIIRGQGSEIASVTLRGETTKYVVGHLEAEGDLRTTGGTSVLRILPRLKFERTPPKLPGGNVLGPIRLQWEDVEGLADANATGYVEMLEEVTRGR